VKALVFSIICAWSLAAACDDDLQRARSTYLNKDVTVTGTVFRVASEVDGRYQITDSSPLVAGSYQGQTARVIAVQEKRMAPGSPARVNALGERIYSALDIEFVVRFQDGLTALYADSPIGIKSWLVLPEDAAAKKVSEEQWTARAQQLVGKNVFVTALSRIYRTEATLADMMEGRNRTYAPQLFPLRIVAAKWNQEAACFITKIELPGGDSALGLVWPEPRPGALIKDDMDCHGSQLLGSLPVFLSANEIQAIQRSSIVPGMSSVAVEYALGFPDHENDLGRGGKQLVYKSGLNVYMGLDGKVFDWRQAGRY
jgi:hypothetical protein